ncbi:hypothetical protein GQ54DRAFT_312220 [Martensiomyces pterosporus]|nr:hypothetical protein GQ54DRAFT_312220 [Martensiomyces pterosporus]
MLSSTRVAGKPAEPAYYGADDDTYINEVDDAGNSITLRMTVAPHHINSMGTLDEGLVATIADNNTSVLLATHSIAFHPERIPVSVSVCLNVQAIAPIEPNTDIDIICSVTNPKLANPHATAVFCDAENPDIIYAIASHTKHTKDVFQTGKL